jgi:hypothetical protein
MSHRVPDIAVTPDRQGPHRPTALYGECSPSPARRRSDERRSPTPAQPRPRIGEPADRLDVLRHTQTGLTWTATPPPAVWGRRRQRLSQSAGCASQTAACSPIAHERVGATTDPIAADTTRATSGQRSSNRGWALTQDTKAPRTLRIRRRGGRSLLPLLVGRLHAGQPSCR